jgi:mycothiol system anti-sigma-R factor
MGWSSRLTTAPPANPNTLMDDCEEILRDLYPYLDGELSESARAEIQGHLDDCLDCLHVYDFQAELRLVIAKKCKEQTVPPGLLARVRECLGLDPTTTEATGETPVPQ